MKSYNKSPQTTVVCKAKHNIKFKKKILSGVKNEKKFEILSSDAISSLTNPQLGHYYVIVKKITSIINYLFIFLPTVTKTKKAYKTKISIFISVYR